MSPTLTLSQSQLEMRPCSTRLTVTAKLFTSRGELDMVYERTTGFSATVSKRIRNIANYGVDEIIAMPLQLPDDSGAFRRTVELLGALAQES